MTPKISKNRQKFGKSLTVDEVVDYDSLCEYAHYILGTPYPRSKDHAKVRTVLKKFFEDYPDAEYRAMTDVITWAKARKKHLSMEALFAAYRFAYQDGYMRILTNKGSTNDQKTLSAMLASVSDSGVRDAMTTATSASVRDAIFDDYLRETDGGDSPSKRGVDSHPLLTSLGLFVGQVVSYYVVPSATMRYGTVIGAVDDFIKVHSSGEVVHLPAYMLSVRRAGQWENL